MIRACAPALLAALPAQAQLTGAWCDDAEIFYLEPGSIGFNEHTVCEGMSDLSSGAVSVMLSCANFYPSGEVDADGRPEVVEVPNPDPLHFTAVLLDPDRLVAHFGGPGPGSIFDRCD